MPGEGSRSNPAAHLGAHLGTPAPRLQSTQFFISSRCYHLSKSPLAQDNTIVKWRTFISAKVHVRLVSFKRNVIGISASHPISDVTICLFVWPKQDNSD